MTSRRNELSPELVWLVPVVLSVAAVCITTRIPSLVLPLIVVALVPWALHTAGRRLPVGLFGVAAIAPVVAILVVDELNASVFLGTTALSLLASRVDRTRHLVVVGVVGIALPFVSVVNGEFNPGCIYFAIGDLFGIAVGVLLGHSRRLDQQLRDTDARLVAASVQEQRTQLARDVHDLVAHSLTVVVLQVGGARRILRTDPARAETALEQAEQVCRESLDGVREVVGLLRADDDAASASVDLTRLVETYRAAGVDVELEGVDAVSGMTLLVRGTLYRVVREALANAARYRAPDSSVSVQTSVDGSGVRVVVVNRGTSGPRSGSGGYGLTGLTEQVASIGGTLSSGPSDGRWVVECRLPYEVTALRGHEAVR